MPQVSTKDFKQREATKKALTEYKSPNSFDETFRIGLGQVVDENLTVSPMLNRQGWQHRDDIVKTLVNDGALDLDKYSTFYGRTKNRRIDS
jgi:hypothetical protein